MPALVTCEEKFIYLKSVMAEALPEWWSKSGQADQIVDLTREELVAIDPHGLLDVELEAFLQAVKRAFGGDAFNLMLGAGLPDQAEEWLEDNFPNGGDRLYSFLHCLDDWPFDSSSESSSEESGDSEDSDENENDEEPKSPPGSPPPPPGINGIGA